MIRAGIDAVAMVTWGVVRPGDVVKYYDGSHGTRFLLVLARTTIVPEGTVQTLLLDPCTTSTFVVPWYEGTQVMLCIAAEGVER